MNTTKTKNRLRVVRADREVTQIDLQMKTGINQSKLSLIERGYIDPSKDERELIATALDSTVDEIFPEQVSA